MFKLVKKDEKSIPSILYTRTVLIYVQIPNLYFVNNSVLSPEIFKLLGRVVV